MAQYCSKEAQEAKLTFEQRHSGRKMVLLGAPMGLQKAILLQVYIVVLISRTQPLAPNLHQGPIGSGVGGDKCHVTAVV